MSGFGGRKYGEYIRDFTSLGNPFILLMVAFLVVGGWNQNFIIIIVGFLISEIVGSSIKYVFPKTRPNQQKYETALEKIDAGSFPSIHSSRISFVYLSLIYLTPVLSFQIIFGIVIAAVAYSRIYLKKHFPFDVMGGLVFGALLFLGATYFFNS